MDKFDPYRKWLAIPARDQPPNHYRLLGLELFEEDLDVIEGAADQKMAYVRQYQTGDHAAEAARILNELAAARLCLLKPASKRRYDEELRDREESVLATLDDLPQQRPITARKKRRSQRSAANNLPWIFVTAGIFLVIAIGLIVSQRNRADHLVNQSAPASSVSETTTATGSQPAQASTALKDSAATKPSEALAVNQKSASSLIETEIRTPDAPASQEAMPSPQESTQIPEASVNESATADNQSELVILRAEFGAVDHWVDLTSRVKKFVARNRLLMVVDSYLVGGDPLFGQVKHLKLRYRLNGQEWEQWYAENNVVCIEFEHQTTNKPSGGLEIHEALYGQGIYGETNWVDVTKQLREKIDHGHLRGQVSDLLQGIEPPVAGGQKGLFIKYSVGGEMMTVLAEEREQISIGDVWNVSSANQASIKLGGLSIVDARYGAKETWIAITDRLTAAVKSGRLFLVTDYHTFAPDDPVPYESKSFRLRFRLHGQFQERKYPENSFVYFETPSFKPPSSSNEDLKILDAWYGRGVLGEKTWTDVSRRIKVDGSKLEVPITSIVSGKPSSGAGPKYLFVRYATKGSAFSICLPDQGLLKIDASNIVIHDH